ncbi:MULTISPECIES: molybdopterin-dependent oxidoreductase [Haloferax]|uniref:Molybdopterin-dependent oxidoreductase n=2 Tax=Haloferax TaxID=2251 RepID=A0A6G1Z6E3_9EURY|nr:MULTISPECIES: molybdopterin-dependent oxidoreductase [Haloferax]KAB1185401.1 molybdopterin-dependent oxidoreductase [Haloferax sp. CBA1149]MRW82045.1 molybdopterin-dependent oxidoreductase [Haloferax marinisediminis]
MTTSVLVRGREAETLDREALEALPQETQDVVVSCASGSQRESTWVGVSIGAVLDSVDISPETTHLAVTADDDCHIYVEIADALSGILALEQDGSPLEFPRLVVPDIDGMRSVKNVVEVEAVSLDPQTDPLDLERHPKIDDTGS